jgi:hypothetical protein
MLIDKINEITNMHNFKKNETYLIEAINENSGFLIHENRILYIIRNKDKQHNDKIDTQVLSLRTNIFIDTVVNNPKFVPGYYNLLIFNGDYENKLFDTFVNLCNSYSNLKNNKTIVDFFYSLIDLFQLPKEEYFNNVIGLYGELYFIKMIFDKYKVNVSNYWHRSGSSFDKYDFTFGDFNVDAKTTIKEESIIHLKHKQVFNDKVNYLFIVNINEDVSGSSLKELIDFFRITSSFSENLDFQIKLASELIKINAINQIDKKYSVNSSLIFLNKNLPSFEKIPTGIYEIEYNYDFSSRECSSMDDFVLKISILNNNSIKI